MPYKDKSRYQSEEWKDYQKSYQRTWHQHNKVRRLAKIYEKKAAIYEYIRQIKSQLCCADCDEQHPAALQFHHLNAEDKAFTIGDAVNRGFSLDRIKNEISKCTVLCANCHAIRHYNMQGKKQATYEIAEGLEKLNAILDISSEKESQRNSQQSWHQRNKARRLTQIRERRAAIHNYIQEIKSQLCCADCGERHSATLQFHHLNAEDKMFNIGDAVRNGIKLDRIKKEIEKCIILCANCHFKRHYNMRNKDHISPGLAGEFEELNVLLAISPEEEDAHNLEFGNS